MRAHAVRQAPVEPGMQKMTVPFAMPANALDWTVEEPISVRLSARNTSPNPSMVLSNRGANASGVASRPEKPVPPVVNTTSMPGFAIQSETIARSC